MFLKLIDEKFTLTSNKSDGKHIGEDEALTLMSYYIMENHSTKPCKQWNRFSV